MDLAPTVFERDLIHVRPDRGVWHAARVEPLTLMPDHHRHAFVRVTLASHRDPLVWVDVISVHDGAVQGFPERQLDLDLLAAHAP
jgi:hypothetical protein